MVRTPIAKRIRKLWAWRIAQGQVYRFGCTGLDAADVLLKFTTSRCITEPILKISQVNRITVIITGVLLKWEEY